MIPSMDRSLVGTANLRIIGTANNNYIKILLIVTVLTMLSGVKLFTNSIRPVPISLNSLSGKNAYIRPHQCGLLVKVRNKSLPIVKRPPWFDLIEASNSTSNSSFSTEDQRPFYLTTELPTPGRLGNMMFSYASLFGTAWRNSRRIPLWNNDRLGFRSIFQQLRIGVDHKSPYRNDPFTTINEPNWFSFNNATKNLPPKNIHMHGYLQNEQYFKHVEDQLRHEFTFSPDVIRQAQSMLGVFNASSLLEQGYVRVVIHIRRTDYNDLVDRFLQQQPDFFNRSMAYFTDCLPKVHFIVISDDISWCRKKIFGHRVDFIEGERSPAVDLAIASLCDHAITTFGTFGLWAAWFANGVTLRLTNQH